MHRWPDDPKQWSAEQLISHAYIEADAIDVDVKDFAWTYNPRLPIDDLLSNVDEFPSGRKEWVDWYSDEVSYKEEEGNPEYYRLMEEWYLKDPSDNPVVVVEDGLFFRIAGGHHRVAIAHKYRLRHVPAVVGRRKEK